MKIDEIKGMQQRLKDAGFYTGEIDGEFGMKSSSAVRAYLRSLMPSPHPWPSPDQASLRAFFGSPGDEGNLELFDFPYPVYFEGKLTKRGRCHRKVKESLLRVLHEIGDRWGNKPGIMEEAEDYGGIYVNRNKRNGSTPSLHAYGAAIDLDDDDNGNLVHWPSVADMPLEIMEAFAREGWTSAGAFWSRDAMHFEATNPGK